MYPTRRTTILIAEEHDHTRGFLADNLTADGYRTLVASDRAKALALLSTERPELIVVDINGRTLELLDAVRSGEGIAGQVDPDTPLIVLTGDPSRLHRIRVLEHGGNDVVQKPFSYPTNTNATRRTGRAQDGRPHAPPRTPCSGGSPSETGDAGTVDLTVRRGGFEAVTVVRRGGTSIAADGVTAIGRLRKSEGDADELRPTAASSARACSRTDRS